MLLINFLEQPYMRFENVEIIDKNENLGINIPSCIWLKMINNNPDYHYLKYMEYEKKEYDNKICAFKVYITSDFMKTHDDPLKWFFKLSKEDQFDIMRKYIL